MVVYTEQSVAALRLTVRRLLEGESDVPTTTPEVDETAYLAAVERHRLVVFLALREEQLDLTPELARRIHALARRERIATLGMARALHQATDALTAAGVRVLSFKGLALAAQAHGDFAARGSGDLDLFVHPADVVFACHALEKAGWRADSAYASPGLTWAWSHTLRNYYEMPLHSSTSTIDLHWHLGPTRHLLPSFDEAWAQRAAVRVGGADVATLGAPDALRHSASHAAKDDWSVLRSLVDVCLLRDQVLPNELARGPRSVSTTLEIVSAQLGRSCFRPRGRRAAALAVARQAMPLDASVGRFPGHRTLLAARRLGRDATSLGDLKRVIAVTLAHPSDLGSLNASRLPGASIRVAGIRARAARRRLREWRHA
ncbi:nucleotidyltransferase family protein [Nocardioides zeae]|uniref:nucleotidyltransferase family protein n=1 Tax=Nocardioides zeae TaxID=1457234 RepID=UPI0027D7D0D6|nr:nucleotidyltransferase family protein [Nocardioides zeae]